MRSGIRDWQQSTVNFSMNESKTKSDRAARS